MIVTNYDPITKTLNTIFSGAISIQDLTEYFLELGLDQSLPDKLRYFEDHTNAEYTFKPNEIKQLATAIGACFNKFKFIKVAILHSKPKETAYSILAMQQINSPSVKTKVFSTKQAATDWLISEDLPLYS